MSSEAKAPGRTAYEAWCASHGRDEAWRLLHPLDQMAWKAAEEASAAKAGDGWIRCSVALPPDDTVVLGWKLGWTRGGTVYHTSGGVFADTEKSTIPQVGVTHWCPMPAPPSPETNGEA